MCTCRGTYNWTDRLQVRLYNFTRTGNADPSIDQQFLTQLQTTCPKNGDGLKKVELDKDSQLKFDVSFFKNVRNGNGILESDQRLYGDPSTKDVVDKYARTLRGLLGLRFNYNFQKAMIKMSSIEVKTGTQGEIRKVCSKFNTYYMQSVFGTIKMFFMKNVFNKNNKYFEMKLKEIFQIDVYIVLFCVKQNQINDNP